MSDASNQEVTFQIAGWSAWADGLPDRNTFSEWLMGERERLEDGERPACAAVPSMLRRRCTRLTRMVLESAMAACTDAQVAPDSVRVVFCSRYAEVGVLGELLESLAASEPMSPKRFSNSVHHTATGYFDLATVNRLPSRTLSAHVDGLALGFVEALGFIRDHPGDPCLLIFADEHPPEPFTGETADPEFPFAVALLLLADGRYGLSHDVPLDDTGETSDEDQVFEFLRWVLSDRDELELRTGSGIWRWKR